MSPSNAFRHQDYWKPPDPDAYELIEPDGLTLPGSKAFESVCAQAGAAMRRAGVTRIILVHGTLAGTDALGWYGHWQRVLPGISKKLKATYKSVVDKISGDRGNYNQAYAELLENSLNSVNCDGEARIAVERFDWSSENHHLGRADAAVRLAMLILNRRQTGEKILLFGHSHAGNVFALVSNLLGKSASSSPEIIKRFFDVPRHFLSTTKRIDRESWRQLEDQLQNRQLDWNPDSSIDMVTFGTPVRYGWDNTGVDNLLHFVNHHPLAGVEPFRGVWPGSTGQFIEAIKGEQGDFVQQTFIARSDLTPAIWSWNAWKGNRILRNLLEPEELSHKRLARLKQAVRVADCGITLLVDYALVDPTAKEVCGHAVYTDADWMAFHVREIADRFYEA